MEALQNLVDHAVKTAVEQFAPIRLRADQLAVTLVDLGDGKNFPRAAHRGDAPTYPASVIKMFYLAATHRWLEDKKIADSPELRRRTARHDR